MSKRIAFGFSLVALAVGYCATAAPVPKEDPQPKDLWIGDRLQKTIEMPEFDDPKTTLKDALDLLTRKSDVAFTINHRAFRQNGSAENVDEFEIASPRPMPVMKGSLSAILREILQRVGTDDEATFLIRGDRIEILPGSAMMREIYGLEIAVAPNAPAIFPIVHLKATDRPLRDLLRQVSDQADVNILVDPRCGDKGKADLTVKLVNAPADTAVEVLADMAGLEMVHQRNVLYVTSPENAAKIRKEQERRLNLGMPGAPFGPFNPGLPGGGPQPPPGGP